MKNIIYKYSVGDKILLKSSEFRTVDDFISTIRTRFSNQIVTVSGKKVRWRFDGIAAYTISEMPHFLVHEDEIVGLAQNPYNNNQSCFRR